MIIVGLSVGTPTLLVLYILNPIILLERSITQYLCAKGYKYFLQPLKNFPPSQVSLNITTHTQPKMTRVLLTGKQPFMPLVPHPAHQNLTTTQVAAASLQRTSSIFFSNVAIPSSRPSALKKKPKRSKMRILTRQHRGWISVLWKISRKKAPSTKR
jgi:hypothetical protein